MEGAVSGPEGAPGVVIVLCHPREGSLCHAAAGRCARAAAAAHSRPVLQDLYREHFDPILRAEELDRGFSFDELVQRYGGELARADLLIFVHPDWWGQPPALLKGWIDRVLRPGVAYDNLTPDEVTRLHVPLLTGKRALVFCPTDAETAPPSLDVLWRRGVFEFCGISDAGVSILTDVRGSTHARRQAWLNDVEASVTAAIGALARGPTGR